MGGQSIWVTASDPASAIQFKFANSYFGQAVNEQPTWDFRKFRFAGDLGWADHKDGWMLSATSPDLRSFRDHHGKLIQYHGWGDPAISPYNSVNYYESVRHFLAKYPDPRADASKPVTDFYRLFMVPRMGHCDLAPVPTASATHCRKRTRMIPSAM